MAPKSNGKNKSINSKTKERVYLTEEEKKVLQSHLDGWDSKPDKTSRDAFLVSQVLPYIQQLNPDKYGPDIVSRNKEQKLLWERRAEAVHTWLKNHKPFKDKAVFKLECKLSLRQVVAKLRAEEIHQLVLDKNPDVQKGDKDYPGLFQQALTVYMKGLVDDEIEELEKTRKEWQEIGPPMNFRLRAAKRYSRKGISNTHQLLHKQMFVSCVTFSFFPDPDTGVVGIMCHDYIADIHLKSHGKKFKTFKEWNSKGYDRIIEDLIGYADYVATERQDSGDPVPKPSPVTLHAGRGLLPLLPPPVNGVRGTEIAKQAQEIIRAYFLRHYQMATGSDNTHTPWAQIGMNPSNYFDVACIPDGFKVQDPSRMGLSVKELLSHLRKRQEDLGVDAFRFHHVLRNQKLEPAEYPPEEIEVLKDAKGDHAEAKQPEMKTPAKSTTLFKPLAKSNTKEIEQLQDAGCNVRTPPKTETKDVNVNVDCVQMPDLPDIPKGLGLSSAEGTTAAYKVNLIPHIEPEMSDKPKHILQTQSESTTQYPNSSEGAPMAFNFLSDSTYHAYNQQLSQPAVYHPMPVMNGPPVQSWPPQMIMPGATLNPQAASYPGPPYAMGPMLNFYHPQYGVQRVPANGHSNYGQSHQYSPPIDPHLQLPPGPPPFSNPHIPVQNEAPAIFTTLQADHIVIQPPTYTPTTSPLKKSPLKRKRYEDSGSATQTPTRRSGRAVRTPKKLQEA